MDFSANELQRIYQLKSEGVQAVLADIREIDDAFRQSAKARADLAGGTTGYDASQMAQVNKQLEAMLEIQTDMLSVMKGLNVEFSKTATVNTAVGTTATKAADSMEDLSSAAKSLGTNLSGATVNLSKVQSILSNTSGTNAYSDAIHMLASRLIDLEESKQRVLIQFSELREELANDAITTFEYEQRLENLNVKYSQVKTNINEVMSAMNKLNATYNSTLGDIPMPLTTAQQRQRGNQELRGSALADQYNPEYLASRKEAQQLERTEVELLKNKNIILNESASYYQRLAAQVNTLKISMRLLSEEEVKDTAVMGPLTARLHALDAEIKAFDANMGNHQRNVGNYGLTIAGVGNVVTMFTRQLARGVGSLIIWGLLFDAVSKVGESIKESIPGTEAYEQAQIKLEQANEALIKSFKDLSDSFIKMREEQNAVYEGFDEGIDQAKRRESITKAEGIANAQANDAEVKQIEARTEVLRKEREELSRRQEVLSSTYDVLAKGQRQAEEYIGSPDVIAISAGNDPQKNTNVQYELYNKLARAIRDANLPTEQANKLMLDLNKAYSDGGNLIAVYTKSVREAEVALNKNSQAISTNYQEQQNLQTALDAKVALAKYSKNLELTNQLTDLWEQHRQLNEKREAESVDRIVRDIAAKYVNVIDKIKQNAVQYAKGIMTVPEIYKAGTQDEDFNAMYAALPADIRAKFDKTIGANSSNKVSETNNALSDYIQKTIETYEKEQATERKLKVQEAQHGASLLSYGADYGLANYDQMKTAVDAKRNADLQANEDFYLSQYKLYGDNKTKTNELAELYNKENEKIEMEHYKNVLAIGTQFFHKITELSDAQLNNLISAQDTYTLQRINKVLAGSGWNKDRKIDKITKQGIIYDANAIIADGNVTLPKAQDATKTADDALNAARTEEQAAEISGIGIKAAKDKVTEAELAYNKALADQLLLEGKITKAQHDKLTAQQHDFTLAKQIGNGLIEIGQTLSDGYFNLLEKQDAYRMEMAHRAIAWNEMIMKSEVQSDNQRAAQERAKVLAEEQLQRDQAQKDKKRAESKLLVSAAIATAKAIAQDLPEDAPKFAIDEGVILAELAIGEALTARAPAYAGGVGSHPGGLAWLGDGGEHELVISPKTPTLTNLPAGSSVVPFSKLSGDMGASLKAPSFSTPSYSSGTADAGNMHAMIAQAVHGALSNVEVHVNYDPRQAQKSAMILKYRTRGL